MLHTGTIKSIPRSRITVWYGNCSVSACGTLQWLVRAAEKIIGVSLPSIMDLYATCCVLKATSIVDNPTYCSLKHAEFLATRNAIRLLAIRLLNTQGLD